MSSASSLAEQVHREVTACIGCHDCLLACPLPEASSVSIAELNDAIRLPVLRAENVIRFVTACTQCRQCVPACPADLSRADMVLFNKMKVEDVVPDHHMAIHAHGRLVPAGMTLDELVSRLAALRLFAGVARADLRRLALKVTLRGLAPGEPVCHEGEFHERLRVVLHGSLEQSAVAMGGGGRVRILVLGPGSFFGEMAILGDQAEPFAVTALDTSVIVEAPKAAVVRLMEQSPPFRDTLESLYARRALFTYAMRPAALGGLPAAVIHELLSKAELMPLKSGHVLFREGAPPSDVFLVRSGFLRVTRGPRAQPVSGQRVASGGAAHRSSSDRDAVLVYFREGDLFGALSLLAREPGQPFTVQAASRAELIRIPGAAFRAAIARHTEARSLWHADALRSERTARAQAQNHGSLARQAADAPPPSLAGPASAVPLSWDVLVEEGLVQGREIFVVDQTRCTQCNGCVDACGRRHGNSRIELRGLSIGNYLFPTACRHCDDPVCLLCSVNGIVRRPSGEIAIVEDDCIGCGACADRCPYGNIRMHPVEPPKRGVFGSLVDFLRGSGPEAHDGGHDPKVARKAVKCDLCAGHDDYACVTACPVGAAFRVDPASMFEGDVFAPARSSR